MVIVPPPPMTVAEADALVRGQLAEFAAGKTVHWEPKPGPDGKPGYDLTIREGEFAGTVHVPLTDLGYPRVVASWARTAWGRLGTAQRHATAKSIDRILANVQEYFETIEAARG